MADTQVLIAGAGPTGLVLALSLARQGLKPRIVDCAEGPGLASRAMVVQARTLEFYRQLGFADEVVNRGIEVHRIHLRRGGEEKATFEISEMGQGISPFPFALSYPQDDHEKLLGEHLAELGMSVEWGVELIALDDRGDNVHVTVRNDGALEEFDVDYVCGCDGVHSAVRRSLDLQFQGGTYDNRFFVADVTATGLADNSDINMCLGAHELCLVFPIRSTGHYRLIGLVPNDVANGPDITFESIQPTIERLVDVKVDSVSWFSTYHVHHRVTDHFRAGRVFVAGDAGHVHSPVGGQGMNTGIGDAVNLALKLAAVLQERAEPAILDTYETERIAFAKSLVDTTDRLFTLISGDNIASQAFRTVFFPTLMPFALGFLPVRNAAFRTVSQTRISYHESALSEGAVGDVRAGDRLPWVASAENEPDNFTPLTSLDWQIHVYGDLTMGLREAGSRLGIPVLERPWSLAADDAGLQRSAYYLIRPDGYIALAMPDQDTAALEAFLAKWKIVARA